jgi:hypothetical protein
MKIKRIREYEDNGIFEWSDGLYNIFNIGCILHVKNGERHNTDGQAVVYGDLTPHGHLPTFYLNGKSYDEEDWKITKLKFLEQRSCSK